MDIRFDNKLVVVTGAAGGIGSACAEVFAASGARVALVDRPGEQLASVTADMLARYPESQAQQFAVDLGDVESIAECVSAVVEACGTIDVLVQAAGILSSGPASDIDLNNWALVNDVNARATFFMMREVVGRSMENGGAIVNFSSMAGMRGMRLGMEGAPYAASKGAVQALTMQAAVEWAPRKVRVNAVAPGGVMTARMKEMEFPPGAFDAVPLGRLAEPFEVARVVAFLASDAASMVTGQILPIDGGSSVVGY